VSRRIDCNAATKVRRYSGAVVVLCPLLAIAGVTERLPKCSAKKFRGSNFGGLTIKPRPDTRQMSQLKSRSQLDRDGRPPAANEVGLKDTVVINPDEVVRIVIRFDNYTDAERPYMYHCHILEHEDAGMMGQFTVV